MQNSQTMQGTSLTAMFRMELHCAFFFFHIYREKSAEKFKNAQEYNDGK